jgi:hypothetical protein
LFSAAIGGIEEPWMITCLFGVKWRFFLLEYKSSRDGDSDGTAATANFSMKRIKNRR